MSIFSPQSKRFSSRGSASARRQGRDGFTLIEMLVVISIMVVISLIFLVRQSRFDSSTVLRSLAYGVALSVRQAQVYGTSVLGTTTAAANCTGGYYSTSNGSCYAAAYGIYFSATTPSSYVLFADLNNDGQYQSTETVKTYNFSAGYSIADICATEISGGAVDCWVGGTTAGLLGPSANLTIVFRRPNPDACVATNLQPGQCAAGSAGYYSGAYIKVQSNADAANVKRVDVSTTGEVSVCTSTSC